MKKIFAALLASAVLTGCYEKYVKDYDYSGVYIAYQYDLRTFVVGEGMKFQISSVLAGVLSNDRDRSVYYLLDDELVTGTSRITTAWTNWGNPPSRSPPSR